MKYCKCFYLSVQSRGLAIWLRCVLCLCDDDDNDDDDDDVRLPAITEDQLTLLYNSNKCPTSGLRALTCSAHFPGMATAKYCKIKWNSGAHFWLLPCFCSIPLPRRYRKNMATLSRTVREFTWSSPTATCLFVNIDVKQTVQMANIFLRCVELSRRILHKRPRLRLDYRSCSCAWLTAVLHWQDLSFKWLLWTSGSCPATRGSSRKMSSADSVEPAKPTTLWQTIQSDWSPLPPVGVAFARPRWCAIPSGWSAAVSAATSEGSPHRPVL